MKNINKILYWIAVLVLVVFYSAITNAAIDKNSVLTAADEMAYQGFRSQGLTIGGNFDAIWDTTITISPGSAWLYPSGSPDANTRKAISTSLKPNTFLRAVTMRVNEDCWFKLVGNGINAKYAGVDSTKLGVIRTGNSLTLECPSITSLVFYGNGSASCEVDIFLMAVRSSETTPLH